MRADLAARIVDDEDGARQFWSKPGRCLAREPLDGGLQLGVERQPVDALLRRAPEHGFAGMRGEHGKGPAFLRHGFALGLVNNAPRENSVEDVVFANTASARGRSPSKASAAARCAWASGLERVDLRVGQIAQIADDLTAVAG
jgi:hypothetical protein